GMQNKNMPMIMAFGMRPGAKQQEEKKEACRYGFHAKAHTYLLVKKIDKNDVEPGYMLFR
ncbi:MAG: hypothetical protein R6V39_02575, partial [Desulfovibrionales bacterium]